MGIVISSLIVLIAVECFFRLPFFATMNSIVSVAKKSGNVLNSKKISDHWKEKVLLKYSQILFIKTMTLASFMLVCALSVLLPAMIFDYIFVLDPSVISTMSGLEGILSMTIVSIIYSLVRRHYDR